MADNVVPLHADLRRRWQSVRRLLWNTSLERLNGYIATLSPEGLQMSDLKFEYPADQPLIITTRTFDAPRALVWKCFSEPQHIARWWGPKTIAGIARIDSFEFRAGGRWRYVCERPDGGESIVFYGTFQDITAPERIVNTFAVENMYPEDPALNETHTFTEQGNRTLYRAISNLGTIEARDGAAASGMETGAIESMAQLADLLGELLAGEAIDA